MPEINIFELPIETYWLHDRNNAYIFEDKITCHPQDKDFLEEGLKGLRGTINEDISSAGSSSEDEQAKE